jgi:dTMP kinase
MDIPVEEGLARKKARRFDRFEMEDSEFHQKVRGGYLKLAASEPKRWLVIDATKNKEEIAGLIWERVRQLLPKKRGV